MILLINYYIVYFKNLVKSTLEMLALKPLIVTADTTFKGRYLQVKVTSEWRRFELKYSTVEQTVRV